MFAMKALRKDLLLEKQLVEATIQEKTVLKEASNHPFLVGINYIFQNELRIYFVM